jgi:pimeloyl-ACP methyl ester carboxylesterase
MAVEFSGSHHGGEGPPLLLVHGFTDTWRTWELVLPALERRFEVLAPTLAGHAGGPRPDAGLDIEALLVTLEGAMAEAGWERAHIAGNSLGGHLALHLGARGRAESVVALAPAGGWAADGAFFAETMVPYFTTMREQLSLAEPHIDALLATADGRRRATAQGSCSFEHIPAELIAHQLRSVLACSGATALMESGLRDPWQLDAERLTCPVRIVWGAEDRILPWPLAAERYREQWLPHADWVLLDGVGHLPQLDVPAETAELIAGFPA